MNKEKEPISLNMSNGTSAQSIYYFMTRYLPFEKVVDVYKLLKHKMETLEDKPMYEVMGCEENE